MKDRISLPVRRAAALAILLALVWLLFSSVVQPILAAYDSAAASVARLEAALQRSRAGEHSVAQVEAELAALKKRQSSTVGTLRGSSDSIAAAQLQDRLKASIEAAKGELRSTQILPARDDGKFRRIAIRAQVTLGTAALQRAFYDIESSSPFLFLDNVVIRARSVSQQKDKRAQDPILDVTFDLFGYTRRPL